MTDFRRDAKVPKDRHDSTGGFVGDVLQDDRSTHKGANHPASAARLSRNRRQKDEGRRPTVEDKRRCHAPKLRSDRLQHNTRSEAPVMNDVPSDTLSAPSRPSEASVPGKGRGKPSPPPAGMIRFACGTCGERLSVPEKYAGRKGACPNCGNVNRVPGGGPPG